MKKCLISLLALLLAGVLVFSFAGCGKDKPITDEPSSTVETIEPPTSQTIEVDASEATTEEPTTEEPTTEAADPDLPPEDLNTLSQAEQLEYFNRAVNRVRTERPGYTRTEQLKIQDLNFTGVVKIIQPVVNRVVANLMPGDLKTKTIAKGANNQNDDGFMSKNANASDLREQDINSIKSTKSGDNWKIEVRVKNATNPAKGTGSTVARISDMQTREEILDSIMAEGPISANYNNANVTYQAVYANITVDAEGRVIEASNGFDVTGDAKEVKIAGIKSNVTFLQISRWTYSSFKW